MAMHEIYSRNDYRVKVDIVEQKACIIKGKNSISVPLEPLTPLSMLAAKQLRLIGCDPGNYLNIGHTNQIILKEAAQNWQQALTSAKQLAQARDTSMIPLFWQHLPGLLELREAEDRFAASMRTASLLLEQGVADALPKQLVDLRTQYPAAAAYICAEYVALSADEKLAARGRQALAQLVNGAGIEAVRHLLPTKMPNNPHHKMRRPAEEQP
jgi:hypothetical protein